VRSHGDIISEELNVKRVTATDDEASLVRLSAKANFRKLGPELGSEMRGVAAGIASLSAQELEPILEGGSIEVAGHPIGLADLIVERTPIEGVIVETGVDFACALDTTLDEALVQEGIAREIVSRVQRLRRDAGLDVVDRIDLTWHTPDPEVGAAFATHNDVIAGEVLASSVTASTSPAGEEFDLDGREIWLAVERAG
jgi:isoleucyl-tRNA synthetase